MVNCHLSRECQRNRALFRFSRTTIDKLLTLVKKSPQKTPGAQTEKTFLHVELVQKNIAAKLPRRLVM